MPDKPAGCLGRLIQLLTGGGAGEAGAPTGGAALPRVMVSTKFISKAEADFFRVLRHTVGDRGHVLAQVALNQLLFFPGSNKGSPGRAAWQNKVARRSLDFLVCDPATLRPLVAVELDDASHAEPKRQTRDDEVEALLAAAGLPLVHVLPDRSYDTRELEAAIGPHLAAPAPRRTR